MASTVRYLLYDLTTNSPLAELPFTGVTFSQRLNGVGAFSGSLNVPFRAAIGTSGALADVDVVTPTQPGRTALYVDIDGVIVWGGIVWTRDYDSASKKLTIAASEFWSYMGHVVQCADYASTWASWWYDPMAIVKRIIDDMLTVTENSIGIGSVVLNGTTPLSSYIQVSYPATQAQMVEQIITPLSQMGYGVGFDFAIDVAYVAGVPTKTVNLHFPRRGRIAGQTGVVVDVGVPGAEYTWPEDATTQAMYIWETASVAGANLISYAADPSVQTAGYPYLNEVISRTNITGRGVLDFLSRGDLAVHRLPPYAPTVTIPMFGDPDIGSFIVGDDIRLIIPPDPRFPSGYDGYLRVVGNDVKIAEEGVSTMTLTLNLPPVAA